MRGRCDAHRATASAMGTGGASHRDARRIGPDRLRGLAFARSLQCSNSSTREHLATSAGRLPSASVTAPTCGPVRRSEVFPKDRFLPPGGSNGRSQISPSGRSPCEPRSLRASVRRFCSAPFRVLRPFQGFPCAPSGTLSLPIASRLSRHLRFAWVPSEELSRRVFRRCCGHRCHPDQVKLSRSLSGG